MEVKTSKSYQKEVLSKYESEKGGEMRGYLAEPTRSQIRDACVYLFHRRNEKNDDYILNRFFQFKNDENKLREIQNFGDGKLRSIENFLKGEIKNTSTKNINLISWLIDFQPRPYEEYLRTNHLHINEGVSQIKKDGILSGKGIVTTGDSVDTGKLNEEEDETDGETVGPRSKWIISISIAFGIILMIFGVQKWSTNRQVNISEKDICMTWADSTYVTVSCDTGPLSEYGTEVKPLNQMELKNMRKVAVDAAYQFFSDAGKPLIWYYKNKDDEHEYFTTPGLHPTAGETLRKITPYIIQTYVPMHVDIKNSFVPE